ncbi:glycosyltransferase family 39 protein [Mucilaginibacter sp. HMF5004]|uniref:ArnT family glycosyltransferase n=1 Tax=Mucilaginibacter rivuli TaxID=2857527 RepID=UPI001C5F022C|nr:glycosyltransferase family 39 protein [Mucilaginibacter rivuli]MBW4888200.1 glycosyltransferase family 39 protein [Mucilaginibacter rivuli]
MDKLQPDTSSKWLNALIALAVLLNFSGLFVPVIAPDGALYATIAKTMALRNDYTNLFAEGRNWLDKPHFPFWITALSFKCFGFTTWAYKLPGILFLMLGARYTYLLAKNLYNKQTGLWAALILLTAEHIVISNNDVRAEPYLTGLIIASVYYFYKANQNKMFWPLVLGSLFAACAVMTKGMFALIPICGAIAGELLIKKQWKELFNFRWLMAGLLMLLFILPEIYCLYHQFDKHPELTVFGKHNVSGIKFFFWDSQFGRFFNSGPIKGHGDPSFFIHTTLWAFLPWSLLLFAAVFQFLKNGIKNVGNMEWYCISGSLLTFLVFSASKFQLPFYTNIIFPFYAILTAQYLHSVKSIKAVRVVQIIVVVLLIAGITMLHYFYQPETFNWFIAALLVVLFVLMILLPGRITTVAYQKIGVMTVLAACIINVYLNLVFYPSLLKYQAGSEAAFYINAFNSRQKMPVAQSMGDYTYPLEFYLDQPLITVDINGAGKLPAKPFLLYTPTGNIQNLKSRGWNITQVTEFDRYWITRLKPQFLNKATRAATLEHISLVIVR